VGGAAGQLGDRERDAAGQRVDLLDERGVGMRHVAGDERGRGDAIQRRELEVDGVVAGQQAVPGAGEARCMRRWTMADGDDDVLVDAGAGQVVEEAQAGVVGVEVGDVLPAFVETEELEVELVELLAAGCYPVRVRVLRQQFASVEP
jgi:hypothetical protein